MAVSFTQPRNNSVPRTCSGPNPQATTPPWSVSLTMTSTPGVPFIRRRCSSPRWGNAEGFFQALKQLEETAGPLKTGVTAAQRRSFQEECRVAEATATHFRSVANQARFVLARRRVSERKQGESLEALRQELESLLKDEIGLARRLHQLQSCRSPPRIRSVESLFLHSAGFGGEIS